VERGQRTKREEHAEGRKKGKKGRKEGDAVSSVKSRGKKLKGRVGKGAGCHDAAKKEEKLDGAMTPEEPYFRPLREKEGLYQHKKEGGKGKGTPPKESAIG